MLIFIVFISTLLGSVWFYIWKSLVLSSHLSSPLQNTLFIIFILSFVLQVLRWIRSLKIDNRPIILFFAYFMLGLMTHLFFGVLVKDLLKVIVFYGSGKSFTLDPYTPLLNGITFTICFIANLWGLRTAFMGPIIRNITITLPNWPIAQDGLRIVQISDLHVGPMIKKNYVEKVVHKAQALNPDILAITGDLGDGEVQDSIEDLEPLRKLHAKHGVFYVTGNHEYYWKGQEWIDKVKELGFTVFHNDGKTITLPEKNIWLAGVPDHTCSRFYPGQISDPLLAIQSNPNASAAKILLAHQPKACFGAQEAGFEFMICGHTHWGQFFPVSLLVGLFNPYHKGLNLHKNMWVYVNAGTGFWGPPLRLGVPSEITCFTLSSKK